MRTAEKERQAGREELREKVRAASDEGIHIGAVVLLLIWEAIAGERGRRRTF